VQLLSVHILYMHMEYLNYFLQSVKGTVFTATKYLLLALISLLGLMFTLSKSYYLYYVVYMSVYEITNEICLTENCARI